MRLTKVESGHKLKYRLLLGAIGVAAGRAPDVLRTMFYRPEYFGDAYTTVLQEVMRGESPWTVGERELFAGFTSLVNECEY